MDLTADWTLQTEGTVNLGTGLKKPQKETQKGKIMGKSATEHVRAEEQYQSLMYVIKVIEGQKRENGGQKEYLKR